MAPPRPGPPGAPGNPTRRNPVDAPSDTSGREHQGDNGQDGDEDDDDNDETNSNYSSVSGDSLPPIRAYGHSYHGSARIYLPNDAAEDERLRVQHELYKLCLGGRLHDATLPIEKQDGGLDVEKEKNNKVTDRKGADDDSKGADDDSKDNDKTKAAPEAAHSKFHILDIGSGNGLWAVEVARRYPSASVLGIDLSSALLPKDVPPNLTFEIADATEPWPSRQYDFIHMRNLVGGGVRDWERLAADALAHLKPGGILEFSDIRPRFYDVDPAHAELPEGETPVVGASCLEYERLLAEATAREGVDFDPVPRVSEWLVEAGVEGLRERADWLPTTGWGNDPIMCEKGRMLSQLLDFGVEHYSILLFGKSGREEADTRALLARVMQESKSPKLRSYCNLWVVLLFALLS